MNQLIFAQRRKKFMSRMSGGVAVFAAAPVRQRNADVEYEYRQDSDFYYLTGFEEPEALCVLSPGHRKYEYILFVRPRDKEKETWTGIRAGVEGAMQNYGAEMAHTIDQIDEILPQFLQDASALYYQFSKNPEIDRKILEVLEKIRHLHRAGIYPPEMIVDSSQILAAIRVIKSTDEIDLLQRAVDISTSGHVAAMKAVKPGMYEYEIQAVLEYVFRSNGSLRNGYPCIVGSGPNACILHYVNNNREMKDGDLLLVDAGAEYGYYTGDITRTYPVNGNFTPEQKAVYEVVLDAQKKAIAAAGPGIAYSRVHDTAVQALTAGLIELGLLTGTAEENIENEAYKKYYLHRTGHWLGMDVHDAGKYWEARQSRILEPGMIFTVEPGLYIHGDDEHVAFRNIGIRIEDDILITPEGTRVLSSGCPKTIEELESITGNR